MRHRTAMQGTTDEIVEVRVVVGKRLIISRVNRTHLARIRQTLSAIERIRSDAVRIGLFELALDPASVSRDFLLTSASARIDPSDGGAVAIAADRRGSPAPEHFAPRFA